MQDITIEKDIPLAPHGNYGKRTSKFPFRELLVGESFFVEGGPRSTLAAYATMIGRETGRKFTVRAVTENGLSGFRVWRLQ
jgi:hypothetical protein